MIVSTSNKAACNEAVEDDKISPRKGMNIIIMLAEKYGCEAVDCSVLFRNRWLATLTTRNILGGQSGRANCWRWTPTIWKPRAQLIGRSQRSFTLKLNSSETEMDSIQIESCFRFGFGHFAKNYSAPMPSTRTTYITMSLYFVHFNWKGFYMRDDICLTFVKQRKTIGALSKQ